MTVEVARILAHGLCMIARAIVLAALIRHGEEWAQAPARKLLE